jgi:hypothetical protein
VEVFTNKKKNHNCKVQNIRPPEILINVYGPDELKKNNKNFEELTELRTKAKEIQWK